MRSRNNPINLCDWCETCEDKYKSIHNCMNTCAAPLEILQGVECDRNAQKELKQ